MCVLLPELWVFYLTGLKVSIAISKKGGDMILDAIYRPLIKKFSGLSGLSGLVPNYGKD